MSDPGYQMTPEDTQKWQSLQRQQAIAQQLMNPQAQGQNSGLANAGSSILGAMEYNKLGNDAKFAAQGISPVNVSPQVGASAFGRIGNKLGNMFGFGGG